MKIPKFLVSTAIILLLTTIIFQSILSGSEREKEIGKTVFQPLDVEFELLPEDFIFEMYPDTVIICTLRITNTGDDTIWFDSNLRGINEEVDFNAWDLLLSWDVSDSVDAFRIFGIVYADDRWIITGGAHEDEVNYFYIFDRYGNLIDILRQPVEYRWGIKDIAFKHGNIWCSDEERNLLMEIDPDDGSIRRSYEHQRRINSQRCITINPTTDHFFISSVINNIFELRIAGDSLSMIREFRTLIDPRNDREIRRYGLAWFKDDPDGFPLYIMSINEPETDPDQPNISIFKVNPETEEIRFVTDFHNRDDIDPGSKGRGGICITDKWDPRIWVMATILDHPDGDVAAVFYMAPNFSWLSYSPEADTIAPNNSTDIVIEINSAGLMPGEYGIFFDLTLYPDSTTTEVPIMLTILEPRSVEESEFILRQFSLEQNFPNPFNSTTQIGYRIPVSVNVRISVLDILGREIAVLVNERKPAGQYSVDFNAGNLVSGIYFYVLDTGREKSVRKMVLVR